MLRAEMAREDMQPTRRKLPAGAYPPGLSVEDSVLRLADKRGLEADLRKVGQVDRCEPAGVRHQCRREGIAPRLQLRPRARLAHLHGVVCYRARRKQR